MSTQRAEYKKYQEGQAKTAMNSDKIHRLESIGFAWFMALWEDKKFSIVHNFDFGCLCYSEELPTTCMDNIAKKGDIERTHNKPVEAGMNICKSFHSVNNAIVHQT